MKKVEIICSVLVLFLILAIVFVGCQQDESLDDLYENEAYLSFSPTVNFDQLTSEDLMVLSQAIFRLDIRENKDHFFDIFSRNAKSVNMSEELFNYCLIVIENSNERILSEIEIYRNRVKTRQEGNDDDDLKAKTDCMAQSIAYATGLDYYYVNSWITNKYGNDGVPIEDFYSVMNTFNNGAQVGFSMFHDMNFSYGEKKLVIALNLNHVVTVISKNGNDIIYWDAQRGSMGLCSPYGITHIYEIR